MLSFRLFGNSVEKLWFSVLATSLWGDSCKMSLRFLGEAVFLVRARRLYRTVLAIIGAAVPLTNGYYIITRYQYTYGSKLLGLSPNCWGSLKRRYTHVMWLHHHIAPPSSWDFYAKKCLKMCRHPGTVALKITSFKKEMQFLPHLAGYNFQWLC